MATTPAPAPVAKPSESDELGKSVTGTTPTPAAETGVTVDSEKGAPIGTVEDALTLKGTKKYVPFEESKKGKEQAAEVKRVAEMSDSEKERHKEENQQPITTLAQLREYHIARGTSPTDAERAKVKALEEEILKEGAKHVRPPAAERGK